MGRKHLQMGLRGGNKDLKGEVNQKHQPDSGQLWSFRGFLALVSIVVLFSFFAYFAFASFGNNQIPEQVLPVNSSSELNLSAYFPEFSGNVWFSAIGI